MIDLDAIEARYTDTLKRADVLADDDKHADVAALIDEVRRLRKALQEIADYFPPDIGRGGRQEVRTIARKALEPKP